MADQLLVTISGPALSLLLYENRRSHDQIGFLHGEIVKHIHKTVTDSDRDIEYVKHHINIKSVEAYPISKPFFNSMGIIDEEILKNFLKDNVKKVVGWFHYRENLPMKVTVRDKILHSELSTFFSKINYLQTKDNFMLCLLNSSVSEAGGTHKFKHLLLRYETSRTNHKLIPVPLKINNLGADATRADGSDYKPTPSDSSCKSDAFDLIYASVKNNLRGTTGVDSVQLIQKAAENYLTELIVEVNKYDQLISDLEVELKELREKNFVKKNRHLQSRICQPKAKIKLDNDSKLDTVISNESRNPSKNFGILKSYTEVSSGEKPSSKTRQ